MDAIPAEAAWPPIVVYGVIIAAALLVLLVFWVWQKGRRLSGDHVFHASRLSRGNHLFPAQVVLTPHSLTLYKPQWIGKVEQAIHIAHVASVKIETHLIFSDIYVETSGGHAPVVCYGHTKSDAIRIKELIERFQSEYYRTRTPQ